MKDKDHLWEGIQQKKKKMLPPKVWMSLMKYSLLFKQKVTFSISAGRDYFRFGARVGG